LHIPGRELESAASASFDSAPKAHFLASRLSPIASHYYPLTWEIGASQASHGGMKIIDAILAEQNTATPHTRLAAEFFFTWWPLGEWADLSYRCRVDTSQRQGYLQ
jgi:hypothetical protein